jgi:hypothetical protein
MSDSIGHKNVFVSGWALAMQMLVEHHVTLHSMAQRFTARGNTLSEAPVPLLSTHTHLHTFLPWSLECRCYMHTTRQHIIH